MKHYLYRHVRKDINIPFYIGIGTKSTEETTAYRWEYYRAYTFTGGRNVHWKRIFNKCGGDIDVDIIMESDDYNFIKEKEVEFISMYGRSDLGYGSLCNMTDGGDGNLGFICSDGKRAKIAEANRNRVIKQETREKISSALRMRPKRIIKRIMSPEQRDSISKRMKGKVNSPEVIEKIKLKLTGRKRDPSDGNRASETRLLKAKTIEQYDINGNLVGLHRGTREAGRSIGKGNANIHSCITGKHKQAYGFIWKIAA